MQEYAALQQQKWSERLRCEGSSGSGGGCTAAAVTVQCSDSKILFTVLYLMLPQSIPYRHTETGREQGRQTAIKKISNKKIVGALPLVAAASLPIAVAMQLHLAHRVGEPETDKVAEASWWGKKTWGNCGRGLLIHEPAAPKRQCQCHAGAWRYSRHAKSCEGKADGGVERTSEISSYMVAQHDIR